MSSDTPNARLDHVYAIIRLDNGASPEVELHQDLIVVKKVVRSKEEAEREVHRLNTLNAHKGCRYYYQVTLLERGKSDE